MIRPSAAIMYGFAAAAFLASTGIATPIGDSGGPAPSQQVIALHNGPESGFDTGPSKDSFNQRLIEQNDTICDAGSRQWTGFVPLDDQRDMFFWYFESRHDPANAPFIIWLNGGPGASSQLGALYEIGPCRATKNGEKATKSKDSWTEFANMLFIDQPIGVGFSDPTNPDLWAQNLRESTRDFDRFLDLFFGADYFPELRGRSVHLACESFGGKYCPIYASTMRRRLDSLILVDAVVDFSDVSMGLYEHFCGPREPTSRRRASLNETTCSALAQAYPSCAKHSSLCTTTYDEDICATAFSSCMTLAEAYMLEVIPGGQHPYDDRIKCKEPPLCGNLGMEDVESYLNKPSVQRALGIPLRKFEAVNMDFNMLWSLQPDIPVPTTREVARVLDGKQTPVLVINGNNDAIVNTEGVLRTYDSLAWSGQAYFRSQRLKDWSHGQSGSGDLALGGQIKTSGNLTVVTVDEAGHMAPHDQPVAVSRILRWWIGQGNGTRISVSV